MTKKNPPKRTKENKTIERRAYTHSYPNNPFSKKKPRKIPSVGVFRIKATFNNTIITLTDKKGHTLFWDTSGSNNFKGAKKRTAYAANRTANLVGKLAYRYGMRGVVVHVKGPGRGRTSAIRGLKYTRLRIKAILDVTSLPFNGCRPPKKRRK